MPYRKMADTGLEMVSRFAIYLIISRDLIVQDKLFTSFYGRIPRSQWWLGLALLFGSVVLLGFVIGLSGGEIDDRVERVIWLIILIPSLALHVKRCHDRDKSGWFALVSFIPLVNLWYFVEIGCLPGTRGDNRFGPDPLAHRQRIIEETPRQRHEVISGQ